MTFTPEQTKELQAPLLRDHVSERQQAGRRLSYIEAWWAIAEANRIFGHDQWHRETIDNRCVAENARKIGAQGKDGWSVSYIAKVRVTVFAHDGDGFTTIIREGTGAGHGIDVDLGLAHESAIKEAESDAMKRALMTFGNPFGLALYDKSQSNVSNDRPPSEPMASEVTTTPARLTAFEATRQGIGEGIKKFIDTATSKELDLWEKNFDRNTQHLPLGWLEGIRDRIEVRREELAAPTPPEVSEADADMDEAFRQSIGPASPAPVARNGRDHTPAHA